MSAEQPSRSHSKSIGEKSQTGKELGDSQKEAAFSLALEFAGESVEKKLDSTGLLYADRDVLIKYSSQSNKVKEYLKAVILVRITDFHQKAVEGNITDADSLVKFDELRTMLCKKLSLCEDEIPDIALDQLIDERADNYMGTQFSDEVKANMDFIRKAAAIVVPINPSVGTTLRGDRGPNPQAID